MREYLFRGISPYTGKWIEGGLVHQTDYYGMEVDRYYIIDGTNTNDYDIGEPERVYPESVGQYTGLTDKNGTKIFEGDIVSTDLKRPYNIVMFRSGCFVFNCNDGGDDYYDRMIPFSDYESSVYDGVVIGNVYDNPELLSRETK